MFRVSKKMLFAVEAVLDIAYHAGSEPVQSREITRRQGIPRRYLEQALQHLVREGVLIGVRGPRGGYRLARERRRISVGEIVRVMQRMDGAEDAEEETGSELGRAIVRPMWETLERTILADLDKVSIDTLCSQADEAGITSEGRRNLDFII